MRSGKLMNDGDRSAFSIVTVEEAHRQDIAFWHSRTLEERVEAQE